MPSAKVINQLELARSGLFGSIRDQTNGPAARVKPGLPRLTKFEDVERAANQEAEIFLAVRLTGRHSG